MSIKVLLADDRRMMLQGLKSILDKDSGVEVVGEAADGQMALEMVKDKSPDVLVMDIGMPDLDGVEATRRIRRDFPKVKVIALSTFSDKRYILETLEAGASAYVLKAAAGDELLPAIRAASQNQRYLSPEVASSVVDSYLQRHYSFETSTASPLGPRKREVLQLLADGKTSKEIAALLHISASTVEAHRRNIMKKLDIHSVAELTKYAIRHGLTKL